MNSLTNERIYLDNAATSWPKPESVYAAVDRAMRVLGAPAGRSGYAEAIEVSQAVEQARRALAQLVGLGDPSHLIFTCNGTDSLNLVLHGLLRAGDHAVTTVVEHNSVLRPLGMLAAGGGVEVSYVSCDSEGIVDPVEIKQSLRGNTRLVAISHASNVTGAIQPVAAVAKVAHEHDALCLCDAAQSLGHINVDVRQLEVDFLAGSGHKGLLGPLGTGILAMTANAARQLQSVRQGGTGTQSDRREQPDELPYKFESGNLNVLGILGLAAGVAYLKERTIEDIAGHGARQIAKLLDGLVEVPGLELFGPRDVESRVPLVSMALAGYDPQELSLSLDAAYRIQVRPGLHCAPLMHEALGTSAHGGTVRMSLGPFTTDEHIETTIQAVGEIAASQIKV